MSHSIRTLVALTGAIFLTGCNTLELLGFQGDAPPALVGAPIQTDSASYHVRTTADSHEVRIGVTYTNPTASTVYIPTCGDPHPPVLQKWRDGEWRTVYSPIVLRCLGPPVVIEAGASYSYTYRVYGARRPNSAPRLEVAEIPGSYRLVWGILGEWRPDGPGLGEELAIEHRVSGSFHLVE